MRVVHKITLDIVMHFWNSLFTNGYRHEPWNLLSEYTKIKGFGNSVYFYLRNIEKDNKLDAFYKDLTKLKK